MIDKLTLTTAARAEQITKELIEIVSGAEALWERAKEDDDGEETDRTRPG